MLQCMELQHPMTCFLGQKVTLIAKKFHLLAALPSFNKKRARKVAKFHQYLRQNKIENLKQIEEQVILYFFLVIEDRAVLI